MNWLQVATIARMMALSSRFLVNWQNDVFKNDSIYITDADIKEKVVTSECLLN